MLIWLNGMESDWYKIRYNNLFNSILRLDLYVKRRTIDLVSFLCSLLDFFYFAFSLVLIFF